MSVERSQYAFLACMQCMKLFEVPSVYDYAGMQSKWTCEKCDGPLLKIGVLMYGDVKSELDFELHKRHASEPMYRKCDMVREAMERNKKEQANGPT